MPVDSFTISKIVTDTALMLGIIIFSYLTIRSKDTLTTWWKSLKFGMSIMALVWIIPELTFMSYGENSFGPIIHTAAMIVFPIYMFIRARSLIR